MSVQNSGHSASFSIDNHKNSVHCIRLTYIGLPTKTRIFFHIHPHSVFDPFFTTTATATASCTRAREVHLQ